MQDAKNPTAQNHHHSLVTKADLDSTKADLDKSLLALETRTKSDLERGLSTLEKMMKMDMEKTFLTFELKINEKISTAKWQVMSTVIGTGFVATLMTSFAHHFGY